jgi:hypothetical protein
VLEALWQPWAKAGFSLPVSPSINRHLVEFRERRLLMDHLKTRVLCVKKLHVGLLLVDRLVDLVHPQIIALRALNYDQ